MDQVPDSIRASYEINLSTEEGSAQNISTTLEALDGKGHAFLWNQTFASFSLAMPIQDLTGDGRDELIIYTMSQDGDNTGSNIAQSIEILSGANGLTLWKKSVDGGLAYAMVGPDLTGDGKKDLLIYSLGDPSQPSVQAVQGDNGKHLWSTKEMLIIPS
ncbi:Uncharacterised protein [uncultured archaeon]|nr:Uncharacterised protein [uncultured archaeon]